MINGKQATVLIATKEHLTALVPLGAVGTGKVSVITGGGTALGPEFTYNPGLVVITIAGNGVNDFPINGASNISTINGPVGIAVDSKGNIYVAEFNRIKKISPEGNLSVFSGSGVFGYKDTTAKFAQFKFPTGLAIDPSGNLIVADRSNACIRKIAMDGSVTTIAGSPDYGFADGQDTASKFANPTAVAVDSQGNIYVADDANYRVRKITPGGYVSTFAGDGIPGYKDGPSNQAEFFEIESMTIDRKGNLYAYETGSERIRMISPSGTVSTYAGSRSDMTFGYTQLGITCDLSGNIFICDWGSINSIGPNGIQYYAGNGTMGYQDGSAATAQFNQPSALATDNQGNIYVCDLGNFRIRKITFM